MEGREEELGIVADTNILISALLKDNSINSKLIKAKIFSIYFPDYGLKEIDKYKTYIIAKRIRNYQNLSFEFAKKYIFDDIRVIPFDLYRNKIKEASEIMKDIDEKDAPIIALAMQLCCTIWSNDKHFMMQKAVKVYTTGNLLDLLNRK